MRLQDLTPGARIIGPSGVPYVVLRVRETTALLRSDYWTISPWSARAKTTLTVDRTALAGFRLIKEIQQ